MPFLNEIIEKIEQAFYELEKKEIKNFPDIGQTVAHIDLYDNEFLIIMPGENNIYLSFDQGFTPELVAQLAIFIENRFHPYNPIRVLTPEFFNSYINNPEEAFDIHFEEYDTHMPLG